MALKQIIGNMFKEREDGPSIEEIDAETEAAVRDIKSASAPEVDADQVLGTGWGEAGDMVYIMSLTPLFEVLGSRVGRTATSLRESCKEVFNKYVRFGMGQTSFIGDNFFMRFYTLEESEGFHRAAVITNEIGTSVLGDRFQTIDVPELVIAAATQDVTNADGSLNLEKSEAAVSSGGATVDKTPAARVKGVQVAFYPTWSPSDEAVGAYACYVRKKTSKGLLYGDAVYPESPADPLSILIDGKKMKLAVRDIESLAHFGTEIDLFLPLRFATLAGKYAAQMAKLLENASPVWRNEHLIFEILHVPEGATAEKLRPLVDWAKTQGRGAAVRTSLAAPKLDRIVASGAEYACFDFETGEDEVPNYKASVAQVHDSGLRATMWNVSESGSLDALIGAGFDLMNGPAVVETSNAVGEPRDLRQNQVVSGY